jgi:serine/threonine protein kinase/WD40 repeat protein
MNPAAQSLETLFARAIEIRSPQDREAFLEQKCQGNAQLLDEARKLVQDHFRAGDFLESLAARIGPTIRKPSALRPGTQIGNYKLLQQIGEGGMGIVYMAQQERPVQRTVALKIIKPGMDSSQVVARFESERQALAIMDHPNIAKVLDAGTTDLGHPYFVMELVKGISIIQYADEHRLTPRQRLELFIPVCQAVQHAHQKGIIHRDLKPTNVLVADYDDRPVPKVIDFGVAKAIGQHLTEKTMFTQFGQVVGTIEYMSPEQAKLNQLDIDTRTDIHSLGVLLYELLTGETPFDKARLRSAAFDEVLRIIREEEPPKPSTRLSSSQSLPSIAANRHSEPAKLSREVRGELDWIVMKALEKDRNRRYESANSLGVDLQRYLANEPVHACPPSATYRLKKFVRRNRGPAIAAALILITLAVGAVVSTWQAIRATRLREEAERQSTLATAAAQREQQAAEQERRAREAAVSAKLETTLQLADNYVSRGLEDSESRLNALPALWFANAAITSRDDPDRVQANLIRVNNWMRSQWMPVAAVEEAVDSSDHLTFDPENSRYLITFKRYGTEDAPPQIWDLATEQPLPRLTEFGPLGDAAWAPDEKVLLGASSGQVVLASMPQLKVVKQWDAGGAVRRVVPSPSGDVVAAATGKKLLVWKVSGEAEPAIVEHAEKIAYLAFSPTGDQLVTATDDDAMARLFAVESDGPAPPRLRQVLGPVMHKYREAANAATGYFSRPPVFVDAGRQLVTIHDLGTPERDGAIKWYDTASGEELAITKVPLRAGLRDVVVTSDGGLLVLGSNPSVSFDTKTRQQSTTGNALGMAFSPNGKFFAFSGIDVEVRSVQQRKIGSRAFPIVCQGRSPAFSHDGKYMAVLNRGLIQVLRLPRDNPLIRKVPLNGRSSWAGLSRDGRYVGPIGNTKGALSIRTIQVREAATGGRVGQPLELDADLVAADFSPDSALIAAVTGIHGDRAQLRIWNWHTGTLVCQPVQFGSEPVWTCFAPDGKAVAVHCMNGEVFLIDPAEGSQLLHLTSEPRQTQGTYPWASGRGTIAFSHDGKTLFTWGSPMVQAWDRATGHLRWAARHQQDCWSLAESPDRQIIATGSYDGYLRFWDGATGDEARPPIEHPSQVLTVAFSPDGRRVGTACLDWQTRVWDVATGKLACAMSSKDYLTDVRFTPDNRFAVNASAAGLQVWDARAGFPFSPVCATGTGAIPSLDIASDGHWAVVAGNANSYAVVDLEKLTEIDRDSPEEALRWAELLSNSRLSASTIVNLTRTEWIDRWRAYRLQYPEFRPLEEPVNP